MLEIRFHGRGGQGTVIAAKILAEAVLRSGRGECMAIPEFGVERRGAPVLAYARISQDPIYLRTRIYQPDAVVVLDLSTGSRDDFIKGLKKGGTVLLSAEKLPSDWQALSGDFRLVTIPARAIALKYALGTPMSPVLNTAVIGALCAALDLAPLSAVEEAVRASVPAKVEENVSAAREAYEAVWSKDHAPA